MKINMGVWDRNARIIVGIAIIGFGIYLKSWWGVIGIIPLGTAFMRVCPLYMPFGVSTNRGKDE